MLHVMKEDLSSVHGQIDTSFAGDRGCITDPQDIDKAFFDTHGYLAGARVLTDAHLESLRAEIDRLMQPEFVSDERFYEYNRNESADPAKRLFHALGAWRVSPAFHDLVFHPSIIAAARTLLGGPVRFWHDQLFVKPSHDGAVVAWHQDYSYWTRTRPIGHLTCWIGLDDSTVENGCVHYVPGSHEWNLLPRTDLANDMDAVLSVLSPEQKRLFKPVSIELRAGEASFHHPMMLHGSYENRSNRPRRAAVLNFFLDGTLSDSDEPLLDGVPVVPKGQKIDGRFFPLLT